MKWWPKGGGENADRTILPAQAPRDFAGPNLLATIRSESSASISHWTARASVSGERALLDWQHVPTSNAAERADRAAVMATLIMMKLNNVDRQAWLAVTDEATGAGTMLAWMIYWHNAWLAGAG
jgi:hypothetical protein